MSKKQKPQLDRATRRKNRRIKVNARIARGRFFKNLSIWFVGLITSWVLVAAILLVFVGMPIKNFVPVRTEENPDGAISINLGDKSIINIFGDLSNGTGIQNYSLGDIPALLDALDGVIKDAGIDKFVCIDIDGLKNVKFVYDANDKNEDNSPKTISSELMKHIEVTASIESFGGLDMLGDFGKISIFSENTAVEEQEQSTIKGYASKIEEGAITLQQLNETLAEGEKFNPILYAYQVDASNYARAFNDNGEYVDGVSNSNQLYYRALKDVPVLELVDIIGESFSRVQTNDILQVAGIGSEGLIGDLIGGKTLEELGEMSTANIYLSTILEAPTVDNDYANKMLYDILVPATKPTDPNKYGDDGVWTAEDISIESLSSLEIDNVKLSAVFTPEEESFQKLIADACGVSSYEEVTISDMTGIKFNEISISTILPPPTVDKPDQNKMLYDILVPATRPILQPDETDFSNYGNGDEFWTAEDIKASHFEDITIDTIGNINLSTFLEPPTEEDKDKNKVLYDILIPATRPTLQPGETDYTNYGNGDEYWTAEDIVVNSLSSLEIDNVNLSAVIGEGAEETLDLIANSINEKNKDVKDWVDITGKQVTVGHISQFETDYIKLTTVLPYYKDSANPSEVVDNRTLYKVLLNAVEIEFTESNIEQKAQELTIQSLSSFNVNLVKFSSVLNLETDSVVYKILDEAIVGGYANATIGSLSSDEEFDIDKVSLSVVVGSNASQTLNLIASAINEKNKNEANWENITSDTIKVGHISQFETDYIKLTTVLPYYKDSANPSEVVDNRTLYKVLLNAVEIEFTESNIEQKAQELTIQSLNKFNVNLVKLTSVISRNSTNGKMFDILKELSGASADDEITFANLSSIEIDNLKLSTILPKTENQNLFKILDKIATGTIEDDGEIRIKNLFGISNFGKINLVDVFDAPTVDNPNQNKMLYDILIQATRPTNVDSYSYGDITISSLSSFDLNKVSLDNAISYDSSKVLCKILLEVYNKTKDTYSEITIGDLASGFSVENIKLKTVLGDSSDNFILNALLNVNGVTIGTLGDAMTNLSLFDVFGHGCFIKHSEVENFDIEVINPLLKYEYKEVGGTATYTLNASVAEENAYYIKKDSGIWMLMCFDGTVEESSGRTTTYTESTLTLGSLEEGSNIASRFTGATIRQLKDAGIFGEADIPSSLDKHTLKEALNLN